MRRAGWVEERERERERGGWERENKVPLIHSSLTGHQRHTGEKTSVKSATEGSS